MADVVFMVPGKPAGQGSMTAMLDPRTYAARVKHPATTLSWRGLVGFHAAQAMRGEKPMEGPVSIALTFALRPPKRLPKARRLPDVRPDVDKLVRAILDALTGIVWVDDCQVVELEARKVYGANPGCHIAVTALP